MSLVEHARRELTILGADQWVSDGVVSVVKAFAHCGHSGGSAPYAIFYLERLLRHEPLSPLSDDPGEWRDVSEMIGYRAWQNIRDGRAISEDGGRTYWLVTDPGAPHDPPVRYPVHSYFAKRSRPSTG